MMKFALDPTLRLWLPLPQYDVATTKTFASADAYGHLCTVTGAVWNGRYWTFDGNDTISVALSTALDYGNDFSLGILFWTTTVGWGWLCVKANAKGLGLNSSGNIGWTKSTGVDYGYTVNVSNGFWHWVWAVFKDGNLQLWLDNLRNAGTQANVNQTGSGIQYIGQAGNNGEYFIGCIAEVRFYGRPLQNAEIQRIYLETKGLYQ